MTNKLYDILKWIAVIVVPALVLLVNTLGQIWGWEYTTQVSLTISAIGVFIGAIIQISSAKYKERNDNDRDNTDNSR